MFNLAEIYESSDFAISEIESAVFRLSVLSQRETLTEAQKASLSEITATLNQLIGE